MDWKEAQRKVKLGFLISSLLLVSFIGNTQEEEEREIYIKPGLLTASGTMSPSFLLNKKEVNYYLTGFGELRISKFFSARGEVHGLLGNNTDKFLKNNLRFTIGMQYAYPFGNFELHTGFSPGFGWMKSYEDVDMTEFVPVIQVNAGARFYIWKYFNFYANFAFTHSQMNNLVKIDGRVNELRIEAGLGFNLQVFKRR